MLVEQIDDVAPESLQRSFVDFLDVLRSTVEADLLAFRTNLETEFGGDHHALTKRSKRFAHQFFIHKWTIHFSSIEKCDAEFDGLPKQRNHLLLFFGRTVAKAHSHTAQPDRRDFQIPKFPLFHSFSLVRFHKRCSHRPVAGPRRYRFIPGKRPTGPWLQRLQFVLAW